MTSLRNTIVSVLLEKNHEKQHLTKAMFDSLPDEEKEKYLDGLRSSMKKHGVASDSEEDEEDEDDDEEDEDDEDGGEDWENPNRAGQFVEEPNGDMGFPVLNTDEENLRRGKERIKREWEELMRKEKEESNNADETDNEEDEGDETEDENSQIKLNKKKEKVKMNPTVKESLALQMLRKQKRVEESVGINDINHTEHGEPHETYHPDKHDRLLSAYKKAVDGKDVVLMMKTKPLSDEKYVDEPLHTETLVQVRSRDVDKYRQDGYVEIK